MSDDLPKLASAHRFDGRPLVRQGGRAMTDAEIVQMLAASEAQRMRSKGADENQLASTYALVSLTREFTLLLRGTGRDDIEERCFEEAATMLIDAANQLSFVVQARAELAAKPSAYDRRADYVRDQHVSDTILGNK